MRKEDYVHTTFPKLWALTVIPVQDDLYFRTGKAERSPALDKRNPGMPTQLFFAFSPSKFTCSNEDSQIRGVVFNRILCNFPYSSSSGSP
jgi:hypothetical protein